MAHTVSMLPVANARRGRLGTFLVVSLVMHAALLVMTGRDASPLHLQPPGEQLLQVDMMQVATPTVHLQATDMLLTTVSDRVLPVAANPRSRIAAPTPDDARQHTQTDTAAIQNNLLGVLQTELARYLRYPPLARERGWQGTVLVSVAVTARGTLIHARLLRSSGFTLLDEISLASLRRIQNLPFESAWFGPDPVEVILPIRFRLADNS